MADVTHDGSTIKTRAPWLDIHGNEIIAAEEPEPIMVYPQVKELKYDPDYRLEELTERAGGRTEGDEREEVVYSAPEDAFSRDPIVLKKMAKGDLRDLVDKYRINHYGTGANGAVLKIDLIDALSNA